MYQILYGIVALSFSIAVSCIPQHDHGTKPAAAALAPAQGISSKATCTPNAFEKFNLNHHHDINTGDVIVGQKVINAGHLPGGTGCSPLWAGGSYDDKSTFPGSQYPKFVQDLVLKKGKAVPNV
jgi:hypothetical protein